MTPFEQRTCKYCNISITNQPVTPQIDDEFHFICWCPMFENVRGIFYKEYSVVKKGFMELTDQHKFLTILCPTTAYLTKLTNRFIRNMLVDRNKIDEGIAINCI